MVPVSPWRQVHMDFHTSPLIPGVGASFDAELFASTLARAGVQSINLFAKCHHGMYYYPTRLGRMHPSLSFDLLGAQVAACRSAGIRTPPRSTTFEGRIGLGFARAAPWLPIRWLVMPSR